ncbi:hypothetical protein GCM10023176_38380 [Micromonospora coerulea]|uniref:Sortase family protein n=1 Tax=Micromonospora coerulea TaxID=47856 RepID=A0ABP8SSP7_9ACTN
MARSPDRGVRPTSGPDTAARGRITGTARGRMARARPTGTVSGRPAGTILGRITGTARGRMARARPTGTVLGRPTGTVIGRPTGTVLGRITGTARGRMALGRPTGTVSDRRAGTILGRITGTARGRQGGAGRGRDDRATRRGVDAATPRRQSPQPSAGRGREPGRTGSHGAAAARLLSQAARRFARATAHAFTASVPTTDPRARPVSAAAVRAAGATGRWRSVRQRGPGAPVLVIAALMVLIVAMLGVERVTGISVLPDQLSAGLRPPPKKFPVLPASPPTDIAIGRIDLRAPVHRVGIAPDGSIAVPDVGRSGEAGWYDQGPTPGQYGPAVIVGHVDTTTGPAVFHELKNLDDGDRVEVTRADRSVAVFEVTSVQRYGKERLPVDEVFGDFSRPNLRLITCGGRWVGGQTGYADNLVVYASLVEARRA